VGHNVYEVAEGAPDLVEDRRYNAAKRDACCMNNRSDAVPSSGHCTQAQHHEATRRRTKTELTDLDILHRLAFRKLFSHPFPYQDAQPSASKDPHDDPENPHFIIQKPFFPCIERHYEEHIRQKYPGQVFRRNTNQDSVRYMSAGPRFNQSETHELDNTLAGFNGIFVRVRASGAGIPRIG
jgi:hypothetical protein